jgi:hypothetical protein
MMEERREVLVALRGSSVSTDPCVLLRRNSPMVKSPITGHQGDLATVTGSIAGGGTWWWWWWGSLTGNKLITISLWVGAKVLNKGLVCGGWDGRAVVSSLPVGRRLKVDHEKGDDEATASPGGGSDDDHGRQPIFLFLRLAEPAFMFNVTEVTEVRVL